MIPTRTNSILTPHLSFTNRQKRIVKEAHELEYILAKVFKGSEGSQIRILVDQQGVESVFNLLDLAEHEHEHQDAQIYWKTNGISLCPTGLQS